MMNVPWSGNSLEKLIAKGIELRKKMIKKEYGLPD
jgi:hypothetical protein